MFKKFEKEAKEKIQRFISEFSVAFKDHIEFYESWSLEEAIKKLKHYYEKSKCRSETKQDWKINEKNNGKWLKKRGNPYDIDEKENAKSYKKFNATDIGQGFKSEERNKGDGKKPLQCWTCVKDHRRRYCSQHQGGIAHIYSAQEVQTVGDVRHKIP